MAKAPPIASLPPEIQRRLLALATKAGIKARNRPRLHGKPHTHRLLDFVFALQQTKFTRGLRYQAAATEPLYAWSAHLGIPIWQWVGKDFSRPGAAFHPRVRKAFKQVLDQATAWRRGEDRGNMPCPYERLVEYVEANFQCAGFMTEVLDIVNELCETTTHE